MVLSSKYNFSLGFIPAVIAILAGTFATPAHAACTGAGTGLVFCLLNRRRSFPLLLYGTTGVLLLLAAVFWLLPCPSLPDKDLPLLFEAALLLPPLLLLARGSRWAAHTSSGNKGRQRILQQSAEAAIVSARILFILAVIHALSLLIVQALSPQTGNQAVRFMLYEAAPPGIFIAAILLNQAGICYFNKRLRQIAFVPVVNVQGEVVGKKPLLGTILRSDKEAIYPLVRLAVTAYGMLYLSPRPSDCFQEAGKPDLPQERFLLFGEDIGLVALKAARQLSPQAPAPRFNFRYYYRDNDSNRLVYLFILDLTEAQYQHSRLNRTGKLWPLRQIEQNLGTGYFSKYLEQEFAALRDIIYTRERYKESS